MRLTSVHFGMPLPLNRVSQHRNVALRLYRTLLRTSLHLEAPGLDKRARIKLLQEIRISFRKQKNLNSPSQCRAFFERGCNWNETFCKWHQVSEQEVEEDERYFTFLRKVYPDLWEKKYSDKKLASLNAIDKLILEDARNHKLEENIIQDRKYKRKVDSWIKMYIKRRQVAGLIPRKSKLDQTYVENILRSKVLYDIQKKVLERVAEKLRKPSTAGLKTVSGTSNDIFVIMTPWNARLFTEKYNFIYNQRKKHDMNVLERSNLNHYKEKWLPLYKSEMQWEAQMNGIKNNHELERLSSEWNEIFTSWSKRISDTSKKIENDTKNYNRRQFCLFQKLKPRFDILYSASQYNMKRLQRVIKAKQIGPYTDIVGDNLGKLMKAHYFKDPCQKEDHKTWGPGKTPS